MNPIAEKLEIYEEIQDYIAINPNIYTFAEIKNLNKLVKEAMKIYQNPYPPNTFDDAYPNSFESSCLPIYISDTTRYSRKTINRLVVIDRNIKTCLSLA